MRPCSFDREVGAVGGELEEVGPDHLAPVARAEDEAAKAEAAVPGHHVQEHRLAADLDHGLGAAAGTVSEPGAHAAAEDEDRHAGRIRHGHSPPRACPGLLRGGEPGRVALDLLLDPAALAVAQQAAVALGGPAHGLGRRELRRPAQAAPRPCRGEPQDRRVMSAGLDGVRVPGRRRSPCGTRPRSR